MELQAGGRDLCSDVFVLKMVGLLGCFLFSCMLDFTVDRLQGHVGKLFELVFFDLFLGALTEVNSSIFILILDELS